MIANVQLVGMEKIAKKIATALTIHLVMPKQENVFATEVGLATTARHHAQTALMEWAAKKSVSKFWIKIKHVIM